jgi:methyl-accepting chemotaxis protein
MGVAAEKIDEHAASVGNEVNTAVTALQFQDMTSQLIDHTLRRIEAMENFVEGLSIATHGNGNLEAKLQEARKRLSQAAEQAQAKLNPVGQESMDSGDIELF